MSAAQPIAKRFDKAARPCPCCGSHSKGCSRTDDGLHLCRGEPDRGDWHEVSRAPDGAGFRHFRRADEPVPDRNGHNGNGRPAKPIPYVDWAALNGEFVANVTDADAVDLAGVLRLPVEALDEAEVGVEWHGETRIYTFPERDGRGEIIGISRRYPDAKRAVPGSRRGLTIPASFRGRGGPVYIVEGASDTLALACCGLAAVGRPSNVGGVEQLAELLAGIDRGREVVIIGENDRKPNGKWPGKEGAESTAKALSEKLGRPVRIAYLPEGYKDSRDRIADLIADAGEVLDLAAVGREFVASLAFAEEPKSRFEFISAEAFDDGDYRPTLLIDQVFVRDEAGIIAGSSKTLKTSLGIDAAISIASGSPFLGTFRVPVKLRVSYVSGESGRPTTQETARRICRAKGFELRSLGNSLNFNFACPTLSDPKVMAEFATQLSRTRPDVVFLDPFYLALGSADPRNMFEVGACLRTAMEILGAGGATVFIVHHANRTLAPGQAMELTHLAYSGVEQFCRQWLLVSRDSPYLDDGRHELTIRSGGSAGHGGRWAVRVEEGIRGAEFGDRRWEVAVTTPDAAEVDHVAEKERAKIEANRKKLQEEERAVLEAIDHEVESGQLGANAARIKMKTGYSGTKVKDVVERLIELQAIEEFEMERQIGNGAMKPVKGYRRVEK